MRLAGPSFVCAVALVFAGAAQAASGPSDFEMRAPVAGALAAGADSYRSPALRAPKRFDLVGMRWSGPLRPTIALRARRSGGRWTKWTRVPSDPEDSPDQGSPERTRAGFSAPVWTGDADYVQYKLSRRVGGLRLHFVSIPRPTRRALASRGAVASDASGAPPIQPRAAWGAEDCVPRDKPVYGDVQVAFVHHTVSANDYTAAEVPSIILSICRYHRNSNGWNDIGYNFLVDKFGTIWEGRAGGVDQAIVGAQAQGYNSHSTGIADIGSHQDVPASSAELTAFASLIRWKLPLQGAPTQGTVSLSSGGGSSNRYTAGTPVTLNRISGHRDGDATECPGDALYAQLPALRDLVGNVQPNQPAQARTRLDVSLTPGAVVYRRKATLSGALRQVSGEAVAGASLDVQAYGDSGWHTAWHATTNDRGAFRVNVAASLSHQIRVRYAGDDLRLGSTSSSLLLKIVPQLKLQRSASRRPVGQTVTLSGTVQPNKTKLTLVVERRAGKKRDRGTLELGARKGRFVRTYRFRAAGLFRFYVTFAGDKANAATKSTAVYVRALPSAKSPAAKIRTTPQGGAGDKQQRSGGRVAPGGGVSARLTRP
jgi:N-acetylmuramoyl-L-alanine amidase-like protein